MNENSATTSAQQTAYGHDANGALCRLRVINFTWSVHLLLWPGKRWLLVGSPRQLICNKIGTAGALALTSLKAPERASSKKEEAHPASARDLTVRLLMPLQSV